ncbi:hypothetical protein AZA_76615 [Nitrospirillum viridazoti Y2]|nr:hypothetical protein AZA_76615 [Nitrospirillum amazonense Y2]
MVRGRAVQQGQHQAGHQKGAEEDGGGAGQQVGAAPCRHEAAHGAAAHAQPAAFRALDQDDTDQRDADQNVQNQDDGGHRSSNPIQQAKQWLWQNMK